MVCPSCHLHARVRRNKPAGGGRYFCPACHWEDSGARVIPLLADIPAERLFRRPSAVVISTRDASGHSGRGVTIVSRHE